MSSQLAMSSQPAFSAARAAFRASSPSPREEELQADNDALVLATLAAESAKAVAEDALRRQTHALALAAHELRTPLMPIRTAGAMLCKAPNPDQLARLADIIERQVAHMTRMIDDLLDAARVTTGKLHIERSRLDLREVFDVVMDMCNPAMAARQQAFSMRVPAQPLVVDGDFVRLTQVFGNLLHNASKYTPMHGSIALDCVVESRGRRDGDVVVAVSDNGIGIPPELLPAIWEPFVQDAQAIGFSKEGLGIGLTLVRELVQAHQGSVAVSSAGEGQGSAFTVVLPLA